MYNNVAKKKKEHQTLHTKAGVDMYHIYWTGSLCQKLSTRRGIKSCLTSFPVQAEESSRAVIALNNISEERRKERAKYEV